MNHTISHCVAFLEKILYDCSVTTAASPKQPSGHVCVRSSTLEEQLHNNQVPLETSYLQGSSMIPNSSILIGGQTRTRQQGISATLEKQLQHVDISTLTGFEQWRTVTRVQLIHI